MKQVITGDAMAGGDTIGAAIAAHDAAGLPGIRRVVVGWGGRQVTIAVDNTDLTPDMIPEPGRVEVVLADGRRRTAEATRTPGHPDHPLDDAALHAKFRSCARRFDPRGTEALLEALTHLDEVEDMRQVARLMVPE